jgi:hypothetical protein
MRIAAGIFPDDILELNGVSPSLNVTKARENAVCLACRSAKLLCGKPSCPILLKARVFTKIKARLDTSEIIGDSPPSAFVGRFGYPKVSFGPMIPPVEGETSIYDTPERWLRFSFDRIIEYRSLLIRGKERAHVGEAREPHGLLEQLQITMLSSRPVASQMLLKKPPFPVLTVNEDSPPFGPSGTLLKYGFSPGSSDRRVEKAHYDRDLKAVDAVCQLYEGGLPVSRIQKAFSVGMFGVAKNRKMVPTRWSITAVDSNLSLWLLDRVKQFPTLDEFRVFSYDHLNNRYFIMLIPANYSYEWIEAWFPNTVWNQGGSSPEVMGDFEPYWGRTTYAAPGGCYYSVRLATAEYLASQRRQATVLALREIYPGYLLPLGVWTVREAIRAAMNSAPVVFDNFEAAFDHILSGFQIRREYWIHASTIIKEMLHQRKISDFV